jgi:hypothetical protein
MIVTMMLIQSHVAGEQLSEKPKHEGVQRHGYKRLIITAEKYNFY